MTVSKEEITIFKERHHQIALDLRVLEKNSAFVTVADMCDFSKKQTLLMYDLLKRLIEEANVDDCK